MINPGVVLRLLAEVYPISDDVETEREKEFSEMLLALIRDRLGAVEYSFEEEFDLVMDHEVENEEFAGMEFEPEVVDSQPSVSSGSSYQPSPQESAHNAVSIDYKRRAVEYWKSGKQKRLSFDSVRNRFRMLQFRQDLYRWETQVDEADRPSLSRRPEKCQKIQEQVLQKYRQAKQNNFIVHDIDLRKWALIANKEVMLSGFTASPTWVLLFKSHHRIVSRKITKMVTKRASESIEDLELKAAVFVNSVLPKVESNPATVFNVDQSGFQREMHSGRTLADKGTKRVYAQVHSLRDLTHSYTIQPLISAEGRLLSPLYVVLQEKGGKFGPIVERTMMKPTNLFVEASVSGKVTKQHIKSWLENVYFKVSGENSTLIIDALFQYMDNENIDSSTPDGYLLELMQIPPGATGLAQPLDVYFFRPWKQFVRKIEDAALYEGLYGTLGQRDNILKLQSLVHHQFSSEKYHNLIKYSWHLSGYLLDKPEEFLTPVKYCFPNDVSTCSLCEKFNFMRCSWCENFLCFNHFFVEYHFCQELTV